MHVEPFNYALAYHLHAHHPHHHQVYSPRLFQVLVLAEIYDPGRLGSDQRSFIGFYHYYLFVFCVIMLKVYVYVV